VGKVVRVLVANRPRLIRELLLATLSDQTWVEVVGEVSEMTEIADHVLKTAPDLIVIDAEEPGKRPSLCDALLHDHPGLRIIAFAPQKNYGACYWTSLDIHCAGMEASEEGFLAAVRNLAQSDPAIQSFKPAGTAS
jgi:DNA-binding NarL/FixJ family response regulator